MSHGRGAAKVISSGVATTGQDGKHLGAVVVKADSPIKTAADLAGRKVAVNTRGSCPAGCGSGWRSRAIAYEPSVLVMDEPFAAVDAPTRAELEDLVRELWRRLAVTVLFVTHDIDEAVYLGERVLVLSNRPTVIMEDVKVDLPPERDQLTTRSAQRFGELRGHVYELIQRVKASGP
jgi:hypothetical protein